MHGVSRLTQLQILIRPRSCAIRVTGVYWGRFVGGTGCLNLSLFTFVHPHTRSTSPRHLTRASLSGSSQSCVFRPVQLRKAHNMLCQIEERNK